MKRLKRLMDYVPLITNETKRILSGSLLIIAIIAFVLRKSEAALLCAIAMFFSLLGDFSLNPPSGKTRSNKKMYIGAGFFMIAHIIYAIAYCRMIYLSGMKFFNPLALIAVAFMIMFMLICLVCVTHSKHRKSLGIAMFFVFGVYVLIIGGNFVTIWSYAGNHIGTLQSLCALGALSFLSSDFIIGVETVFKVKNDILRKLVWILYPLGQILIILCQ